MHLLFIIPIVYITRLYCIINEYYIHEQWQRAAECGDGYRCSGRVKLHMRSENNFCISFIVLCAAGLMEK